MAHARKLLVPPILIAASVLASGLVYASPNNTAPVALLPGYSVTLINVYDENHQPLTLRQATSLAVRGNELLVIEGGRAHFEIPYDGQTAGRLLRLELDPIGPMATATVLAPYLADPIGVVVAPDGTPYFTQYGVVSRLGPDGVEVYSAGYPSQTPDTTFLPGSDANSFHQALEAAGQADLQDFNTTGTMSLAFLPDGTLVGTQGLHGRPPDDPVVADLTGKDDYATEFSSSILRIEPGNVSTDDYVARGCRNCFDIAVAPPESPLAGRIFLPENSDVYRGRIQKGQDRTVLAGSTPTDTEGFDTLVELILPEPAQAGLRHQDHGDRGNNKSKGDERSNDRAPRNGHDAPAEPNLGRLRKVASFVGIAPTLGAVPTGIAFAPSSFYGPFAGMPVVAVFAGEFSPTGGYVTVVIPDEVTGVGTVIPIVGNLRNPIDVAFDGQGNLYVLEYGNGEPGAGRIHRITRTL